MKRIYITDWRINHYKSGTDCSFINDSDFVPEGFLNVKTPELVQGALRRYGIIQKPVFGKNVDLEKWVEESDWVYYTEFYAEEKSKKVYLCFDGLDTFCDIYLNGQKIAFCRNMHIPYKFDVTRKLNDSKRNRLYIKFYSPVKYIEKYDKSNIFSANSYDRIYARKAQMNYGWDFCGRCVTLGIWKDVYLEYQEENYIDNFYLYTKEISENGNVAKLGLSAEISTSVQEVTDPSIYKLSYAILDGGNMICHDELSAFNVSDHEIIVKNPRLWWPRPYGKQPMYKLVLSLSKNDKLISETVHNFGIRTIKIIQEIQPDGKSFIFCVNGKRIFVRGANWVPLDTVYTSICDGDYEKLIQYAVEGNISMLRVWGGGIYEEDIFFRLCDENGILVFQDFMLACGIYPQTEEFFEQIREEAEYTLKRYRNYTSLAMWSGDNEDDEAYTWAGKMHDFVFDKVNKVVIADCWKKLDSNRNFAASSPYSPDVAFKGGDDPNSTFQGDMHMYMCGLNKELPDYYKNIKKYRPRFVSEFGFISLPEKETYYQFNFLRKIPSYEQAERVIRLNMKKLENEYWINHSSADSIDIQNDMIYFFQMYNSLALKCWIEYFRSLKWTCAGSLYWKFNDPIADNNDYESMFPTLMSTIDFYKRPKMTFYYTKRAYENTIVFCNECMNGDLEISYANEEDYDMEGTLQVKIKDFSDNDKWSFEKLTTIQKDGSGMFMRIKKEQMTGIMNDLDDEKHFMKITFRPQHGNKFFENIYYFVDICEILKLKLYHANIQVDVLEKADQEIVLNLSTDAFVPCLRIGILDTEIRLSDNYFPLDVNDDKTVKITISSSSFLHKAFFIEAVNVKRKVFEV